MNGLHAPPSEALATFLTWMHEGTLSEEGFLQRLLKEGRGTSEAASMACTLSESLMEGIPFATALERTRPNLPGPLIRALDSGARQSQLDVVLDQARTLIQSHDTLGIEVLAARLEARRSVPVCGGCFDAELEKILQRAALEKAPRVVIAQEEGMIRQVYAGAKPVVVREMAFAAHLASLRTTLDALTQRHDGPLAATAKGPNTYALKGLGQQVDVTLA